jgi:hypothetical protein
MLARRTAAAALVALLAGCAAGPTPEEEAKAEQLAHAVARLVRLHHELRLAARGQGAAPSDDEVARARDGVDQALRAEGGRGLPAAGDPGLGEVILAARNHLLRGGYVLLPAAGDADPPILSKVVERVPGLSRRLWGRTVRYRRLVHEAPLVPDFATFAAVRTGEGTLSPPLARFAGPTAYLDRDAAARVAGREGEDAPAEALAELAELEQVARMRFADEVALEELVDPRERQRALKVLHARVLLSLLHYSTPWGARRTQARLRRLAEPGSEPVELAAAARLVRSELGRDAHALDHEALRARAAAIYAKLEAVTSGPR